MDKQYLNECLEYSCDTGELIWRERPLAHFKNLRAWATWNHRYSRKLAGCVKGGRRVVSIDGVARKASRLIWIMVTGEVPSQVDHKDGDTLNNRLANLRATDHAGNQKNRKVNTNSATGVPGVYVDRRTGRYRAQIGSDGSRVSLGSYGTLDEAKIAREEAQRHYGFAPEHGTR